MKALRILDTQLGFAYTTQARYSDHVLMAWLGSKPLAQVLELCFPADKQSVINLWGAVKAQAVCVIWGPRLLTVGNLSFGAMALKRSC